MRKLCFLASVISVICSSGVAASASSMEWRRTWLDEVQLRWQPPVADENGMKNYTMTDWKPKFSFDVAANCTVSDGKYIYSGSSSFTRYDMEGNAIDRFSIPGLPEMYCMAYDGERYFYGTCYEQYGIYKVDMDKRELVEVIPTKNQMYHIAYIPTLDGGKGGFEVGNPMQGNFLSLDGSPLEGALNYSSDMENAGYCYGTTYANGKLYAYCAADADSYSRRVLEYDLKTMKCTDKSFQLNDFIGEGGVQAGFQPRNVSAYAYPYNESYLMLVNYNGRTYNITSVLIGENSLVAGLSGYNVYRNGEKVNSDAIDAEGYSFTDRELKEGISYAYEIKGVGGSSDGKTLYAATVELPATDALPFVEDFSSYLPTEAKFLTNYWVISPELSERKWNIFGNRQCIQFSYSPETKYEQALVSKPLSAPEESVVTLSMDYACNYYGTGVDNEKMTVEVSTDGGTAWTTVGGVNYAASTTFKTVEFDLSELVAGKSFRFRLKGAGENPSVVYGWQIDNIKVWSHKAVNAEGRVKFVGNAVSQPVSVAFSMEKIGKEYDFKTDDSGSFNLENVESGIYDVTVSSGSYSYTFSGYEVDGDKTEYVFDVPGSYFEGDASGIDLRIAPNASQEVAYLLTNAGNEDAPASAVFDFGDVGGAGETYGHSDLATQPGFALASASGLPSTNETGLFYYEGLLWTNASTSTIKLNGYTLDGALEKTVTLTVDGESLNGVSGFFVADGEMYLYTAPFLWSDPAVPAYIAPIDWTNKKVLADKKIALDSRIASVASIAYYPAEQAFFVRDQSNMLYKTDKNGAVLKSYTLPSINYSSATLDTFSKGGPYLWMLESKSNPTGFDIVKYSIPDEQMTLDKYSVNNDPESIFSGETNTQIGMDASLTASTQLFPGYYSLALRQRKSANMNSAAQLMVYRLFPIESWLSVEKPSVVSAGLSGDMMVSLDATGLSDGEEKSGSIVVSSAGLGKDLVVPVKLHVDASMAAQYPAPTGVKAAVNKDYEVELTWTAPSTTEKVKGYSVLRDGEEPVDEELTETSFTDRMPRKGEQQYRVAVVYESGYRAISEEAVKADVSNPNWGMPVENMAAKVAARKNVVLSWDKTPRYRNAFFDDFESYTPFSTESVGNWTLVDGDRMWTYANNSMDYPHEGERLAGMVYNPKKTNPADAELGNGSEQCFAFFSGNISSLSNNDWLISPSLSLMGRSVLRFEAKTLYQSYGKEKINVAYSATGNNPDDFVRLNATPIEVDSEWTTFEFDIPANAKYVAINYVSSNTFVLFVDNVLVGPEAGYSSVMGFNVYRNGSKLNSELMQDNGYVDYGLADGNYSYVVETVYENGSVARTDSHKATVDSRIEANAPRDLSLAKQEDDAVALKWKAPEVAAAEQLRYDNGEVADALGGEESMYAAISYSAADMQLYDGYSIVGMSFHISEPVKSLTPILLQDGLIVRTGKSLQPEAGKFTEYMFDEPLKIEKGHSYMIGYHAEVEAGCYPLSHDAGPSTPGKGDLISSDGRSWTSAYSVYGSAEFSFNWSIAAKLEPVPEIGGSAADRFEGYNVYRNAQRLNAEPLTGLTYEDIPKENASYYVTAIWSESGELASEKVVYEYGSVAGVEATIRLYPNPVSDCLNVDGAFDSVEIHSLAGVKVFESHEKSGHLSIPVSGFEKSMYIVTITNGDKVEHHKVMIE